MSFPPIIPKDSATFKCTALYCDYADASLESALEETLFVDSRGRDRSKYPYATNFALAFNPKHKNRGFALKLNSIDFVSPGSSANRKSNTGISWRNMSESSIGSPVYTAYINPGLYTVDSIVVECQRVMNLVPRKLPVNGSLQNHTWSISQSSPPNNGLTFYNIILSTQNVPVDPISTVANSSFVTITQTNHNFKVGDIVYLQDVQGSPGGVPDEFYIGAFTATQIIDADSFTIQLKGITPFATSTGGGNNVKIGYTSDFAFVSSATDDESESNLLQLLGFPRQSCIYMKDTLTLDILQELMQTANYMDRTMLLPASVAMHAPFSGMQAGQVFQIQNAEAIGIQNNMTFKVLNGVGTYFVVSIPKNLPKWNKNALYSNQDSKRVCVASDFDNGAIGSDLMQTNIFDTGTLFGSINLSGEVFCFINVNNKNIGRIQFVSSTGYFDFNNFVSSSLNFDGNNIPENLLITLTTSKGDLLYFGGLDYSASFQVSFEKPRKPIFLNKA